MSRALRGGYIIFIDIPRPALNPPRHSDNKKFVCLTCLSAAAEEAAAEEAEGAEEAGAEEAEEAGDPAAAAAAAAEEAAKP